MIPDFLGQGEKGLRASPTVHAGPTSGCRPEQLAACLDACLCPMPCTCTHPMSLAASAADAHKFVEEQIKYSEAVRQEQSGSDEDREDGEVQEDEAEGREHRSPGSGPPRQLQGMPTAFATPAAALGRQQPQHVPGPGSQSSMASPEKLRPQTQATKRAVPGAGIMGGPAKLNFYRPFQTYKRLENLIPAEPAPLPKRGAGHAISSVAGAVPPLTYRVSAARPDSPRGKVKVRPLSHEHPARQGRHHPNRSPPGKAAKVPPPATPQLAFVSEGLRLPSIAAMTGTATRPLRWVDAWF